MADGEWGMESDSILHPLLPIPHPPYPITLTLALGAIILHVDAGRPLE